ncbi:prenyltransferase [Enterococcus alishanensis]|uniref:Prenyltransferase n=1 Tax=Enterococcus alishanensis TaxID=1303817 RepID=A0ABS6TD98_9ENTE|nr:prenyltransferase [Enterococcus alishanensis]MBV7390872.1 prenyltransferase [Enterococcus alishanensis]
MENKFTFRQFWELSEIYTAPLNLFLILMGVSIAMDQFDWGISLDLFLYGLILIIFHVTANIFNHYMDYKNASDQHYREVTNVIGREKLSLKFVRNLYLICLFIAFLLGVWLVLRTNIIVGILGLIGFYIGLFYSYGKHPLNSLPIAEVLTGTTSGFFIPVIGFYLAIDGKIEVTPFMIFEVFILCLPLSMMMFNNLLANNTSDLEEDVKNGRKTLVYYLGKKTAVSVLLIVFAISYLLLPIFVFLGIAPWPILILFLFLPKSIQGLKIYQQKQDKATTFPIVLKTMSLVMIGYPLLYFIGSLIHQL